MGQSINKEGSFCSPKRQGLQLHVFFAQAPQFGSQFSWEPLPRVGAEASRADTKYVLSSTYMAEINTRKKRSRRDVHHG